MTRDYTERYGSWALVVGASQGLGAALADELASRGMNVALAARREGPLREVAQKLAQKHGVQTKVIPCDAASPDIVQIVSDGLDGEEPDFIVYNCASEPGGLFVEIPLDEHLENIVINCVTPTRLLHSFVPGMIRRKRGGIVICSSLAAEQGLYNWVTYGAAKAYELILGEGLWEELRDYNIGATAFMIGTTYTPNFKYGQSLENGIFAETHEPEGLPEGVQRPQLPEDAAANLFKQIDQEWLPKIFANPLDEANFDKAMRTMSRKEFITTWAKAQRERGPLRYNPGRSSVGQKVEKV